MKARSDLDKQTVDSLSVPLVVVSDIHLRSMDQNRSVLLMDVLRRLEPGKVEYLVLNGDIFDFCFGSSDYFKRKFERLGHALQQVVKGGTRVLFIEGNHEFHICDLDWPGIEFIAKRDYVITLKSGERIKIAHGDLIKRDFWYGLYRGLVKSKLASFCARLLPGRWVDAFALSHSARSRTKDVCRELDHAALMKSCNDWLLDGIYDHGIFGHFHVPYAEKRLEREGYIVSVDSWDKPNLLLFDNGGFFRSFLEKPRHPFAIEPASAYLR